MEQRICFEHTSTQVYSKGETITSNTMSYLLSKKNIYIDTLIFKNIIIKEVMVLKECGFQKAPFLCVNYDILTCLLSQSIYIYNI